jgi:desampylase
VSGLILRLSANEAARLLGAAQTSFPNECCGLIEGRRADDDWYVVQLHEMPNIADDPQRHFLIDPQPQIQLLRRLRGTDGAVIGCFHSHPNGRAEPSATDLKRAFEDQFVWLIAGGGPDDFAFAAYLFSFGTFTKLTINVPE